MRLMREFRILPVVLFAAVCLLALKMIGIVRGSGYVLPEEPFLGDKLATRIADSRTPRQPQETFDPRRNQPLSWAQEMFGYPDITGSVPEKKPAEKPADAKKTPADPPPNPGGKVVKLDGGKSQSPAERAILERLQERRQEIDARAREIDIREGLLKAAETKLEQRLAELKEMEKRINDASQAKEDSEAGRFKGLITMYENMKPKDAAKVFDRLELPVLVQVTNLINPRKMSDILGQMSPEAAERLTTELASRASGEKTSTAADLPKIQGRPGG
jgi:flagellar motility protein MotE (MotC chaperone)